MFNSSKRSLMKEEITRRRLVLSLKGLSCEKAIDVAKIAYNCGIKTFEVSLKSLYPGKTLEMLISELEKDAIVGVGDVFCAPITGHDVVYACQRGAMFLDTPIWCEQFSNTSRVYDCVTVCGAETLASMYSAHKLDASFIRLPLLSEVTATKIKEIRAIIDNVRICLYGEIEENTLKEYFDAGLSLYILDSDIVRDLANSESFEKLAEYFNRVKKYTV